MPILFLYLLSRQRQQTTRITTIGLSFISRSTMNLVIKEVFKSFPNMVSSLLPLFPLLILASKYILILTPSFSLKMNVCNIFPFFSIFKLLFFIQQQIDVRDYKSTEKRRILFLNFTKQIEASTLQYYTKLPHGFTDITNVQYHLITCVGMHAHTEESIQNMSWVEQSVEWTVIARCVLKCSYNNPITK